MVSMVLLRFISGTLSRVARGPHVVEALACYYYRPTQLKHKPRRVPTGTNKV